MAAKIIRKSSPTWAARCVKVRKNDVTLWLCQDHRALHNRMKTDSGGLSDIRGILERVAVSAWVNSINLASWVLQLPITEPHRHKPALRDAFRQR